MSDSPWRPSRTEQRLLWYLDLLLKFGVGGGGIVWELILDHARNPLVLLVCALLATSTNAFQFLKRLIIAARADEQAFRQLLDEEDRLHEDER